VAALDEADAVLGELPERVDHRVNGVHSGGAGRGRGREISRGGRSSLAWRRRRRGWICACFALTTRRRASMCPNKVPRHTSRQRPIWSCRRPKTLRWIEPNERKAVLECLNFAAQGLFFFSEFYLFALYFLFIILEISLFFIYTK
jgi:hypothetical protein